MNTFIISKRTPPSPHQGTFNHRLKSAGLLLAVFTSALLLTACPPPDGNGTTNGEGTTPAAYTTTVEGTVTDPSGREIEQAEVAASNKPSSPVRTQSGGSFTLQVTHRGTFTLTVTKSLYRTLTTPIITTTEKTYRLPRPITLAPLKTYTTTVSGKVTDPSGAPAAQAEIAASSAVKTQTYSDGTFAFKITHPGEFTLTVTKAAYKPYTTPSIPAARNALTLTPVQLAAQSGARSGSGGAPNPGAEPEGRSRFTLEQNPGTESSPAYTLSITEGVETIEPGEFASESRQVTDPADSTRQITAVTKLAGLLGSTNQDRKVTTIELPDSLVHIREDGLARHRAVNGELIIPAAVESIGKEAFATLSNSSPSGVSLKFAPNSKLKVIGDTAFQESKIVGLSRLPDSLESIEAYAFSNAFAADVQSFTIPANVKSVGTAAFMRISRSQFTGTLTIESPHLTRTPPLDPPNTPGAKRGRFGDTLLQIAFGGGPPTNQLTAIYLPRVVFDSYNQTDLNDIFGTFAKPEGKYVDIADKTTELTK